MHACLILLSVVDLYVHVTDFGAAGECVELIESKEYVGDPAFGTSTTQLHKVHTHYSSNDMPL